MNSFHRTCLGVLFFSVVGFGSEVHSANAEDALIFHVVRSPGIDWTSPRSLAKSTIRLRNTSYSIGHVTVEIRCGGRSVKTGMTQRYGNESARVVRKEGQALGVLFHNFHGKHQEQPHVDRMLTKHLETGRLGVIKFLVSRASCERMLDFQENFVQKRMFETYGTLSRPLEGEGGGCSAYSVAYAATGGFMEPWMVTQWGRYHRVPRGWVGGPLTNTHIGVLKLMRKAPLRWAKESEKGFPIFLYDPDKMYRWARSYPKRIPVTEELLGVPITENTNAFAIEIDQRSSAPPPERNYSPDISDPRRALETPALLEKWWEKEIQILRKSVATTPVRE